MRTRPYMSPTRPRLTTSTAVTSRKPIRIHRKYDVLPGASGWSPMPRKMSGSEMSRIDWLIVTIRTPSVALNRTVHLYRSPRVPVLSIVRLSIVAGTSVPRPSLVTTMNRG